MLSSLGGAQCSPRQHWPPVVPPEEPLHVLHEPPKRGDADATNESQSQVLRGRKGTVQQGRECQVHGMPQQGMAGHMVWRSHGGCSNQLDYPAVPM